MKPDDLTRLRHMLDAALEAVSFLGDLDAKGLDKNRLVCQAVVRSLEIVGEAAAQISPAYCINFRLAPFFASGSIFRTCHWSLGELLRL